MYARTVAEPNGGEEQLLSFGVSGKLIMNVLVMFDNETETYWSQLLGEALEGPLAGAKLTPLASVQTTWAEWKKAYPDTKALRTGGTGGYDTYDSYYNSGSAGVLGETRQDNRLNRKELIAGAVLDGQPIAYPHSALRDSRVVNDTINGQPLAVFFDPTTRTAVLYERTVIDDDGQEHLLTFQATDDPIEFVDQETGSRWLLLNGMAIDGDLQGSKLTAIPSTSSFWFGWKDWYPETLLYGQPEATSG